MSQVRPALPEELEPALRLVLRRFGTDAGSGRVRRALDLVAEGELPADGVLVAPGPRALLGAIVCVPLPGKGGLVWAPQTAAWLDDSGVEDALVRFGLAWLRRAEDYFHTADVPAVAIACRGLMRHFGAPVQQRRTGTDRVPGDLRELGVTVREYDGV